MDLLNLNNILLHHLCGVCVYGAGHVPGFLVSFAVFCAKYLVLIIPAHIIYMSWNIRQQNCSVVAHAIVSRLVLALVLACAVSFLVGWFCYEARPFINEPNLALLSHRHSSSMPSNHALVFSVYLYFLFSYYKELTHGRLILFIATIFMVLTCWARVFTAIHYPFDIVAGVFLGALCAWVVDRVIVRM